MSAESDRYAGASLSAIKQGGYGIKEGTEGLRSGGRTSSVPITKSIDQTARGSKKFYDSELTNTYSAGARYGSQDPAYALSKKDQRFLDEMRKSGKADIDNAAALAKRDSTRIAREARKGQLGKGPRDRVRGARYKDGRFMSMDGYADMRVKTDASIAYNEGTISGATAAKVEWFEVQDSAGCGLSAHDDPQGARGLILTADECRAHLIGHPYCGRTFKPLPGHKPTDKQRKDRSKVQKVLRGAVRANVAIAGLNAATAGVALTRRTQFAQRLAMSRVRGDQWGSYFKNEIRNLVHEVNAHFFAQPNVIDIRTGMPLSQKFTSRTLNDFIDNFEEHIAEGRAVPTLVKKGLGLTEQKTLKVVGDTFGEFTHFVDKTIRASLSVTDVDELTQLTRDAQQAVLDWVGPRNFGNRFMKFSMPNMGGAGRRPRLKLVPDNKFIKPTLSLSRKRGIVPNLRINPHGLFRVGFQYDPDAGMILPNLSIVPRGPLHIETKLNRSGGFLIKLDGSNMARAKQFATQHGIPHEALVPGTRVGTGAVTSMSVKVRVIVGWGPDILRVFDPTLNFRLNLRKLGLHSLHDIKRLTVGDFQKLGLGDIEAIRMSMQLNLKGYGPFKHARLMNMGIGEGAMIQELGWKQFMVEVAKEKAESVKDKMRIVNGLYNGQLKIDKNVLLQNLGHQFHPYLTETFKEVRASLGLIPNRQIEPFLPSVYRGLKADAPFHQLVKNFTDYLDETADRMMAMLESEHRVKRAIVLARDMQVDTLAFLGLRPGWLIERELATFFSDFGKSIRPYMELVGMDDPDGLDYFQDGLWFDRFTGQDINSILRNAPHGDPIFVTYDSAFTRWKMLTEGSDIDEVYEEIMDRGVFGYRNTDVDKWNKMIRGNPEMVEQYGQFRELDDRELEWFHNAFGFLRDTNPNGPQVQVGVFHNPHDQSFAWYKFVGPNERPMIMINQRWLDDLRLWGQVQDEGIATGYYGRRSMTEINPITRTFIHEYGHATVTDLMLNGTAEQLREFSTGIMGQLHRMWSAIPDSQKPFEFSEFEEIAHDLTLDLSYIEKISKATMTNTVRTEARYMFMGRYMDLWEDLLEQMPAALEGEVSLYATKNFQELMAETFANYLVEDVHSEWEKVVGEMLVRYNN